MEFNPVSWFEIYVQDMARATKFYESVLAISLSKLNTPAPNIEMMAFPMDMQRGGASGALARMDGVPSGGNSTLVYFNCKDCAVEAGRIEAAGGKLHTPKTSLGEYGFMAMGIDPDGNMFGLHSME